MAAYSQELMHCGEQCSNPRLVAHQKSVSESLQALIPDKLTQAWLDESLGKIRYEWDLEALQEGVIDYHQRVVTTYLETDPLFGLSSFCFSELCTDTSKTITEPLMLLLELQYISNDMLNYIILGSMEGDIPLSLKKSENCDFVMNQMFFERMMVYLPLHQLMPELSVGVHNRLYAIVLEEKFRSGLGRAHLLALTQGEYSPNDEREYDQAIADLGSPWPLRAAARLAQVVTSNDKDDRALVNELDDIAVACKLRREYEALFERGNIQYNNTHLMSSYAHFNFRLQTNRPGGEGGARAAEALRCHIQMSEKNVRDSYEQAIASRWAGLHFTSSEITPELRSIFCSQVGRTYFPEEETI